MGKPLILGIVGEKSSGKSIVFEYLATKRGIFSGRTSAVLEDILRRLHLDVSSRPNNAKLAEALRHTFGQDILPQAVLADAAGRRARVIVVEGIRRLAELAPLRRLPNFRLLYVTAPIEVRWHRAQSRTQKKRSDDQVTLAQYRRIEQTLITEKEVPRLGRLADVRINNTGTKRQLFSDVDAALRRLSGRQ
ncbi:MAG: hypothetical protein HY976_01590 [Candidatus Kerfeldbacteria bacterium]|nr:hypothetical protein [Candidatus Kerfeldbacteria bacterium]